MVNYMESFGLGVTYHTSVNISLTGAENTAKLDANAQRQAVNLWE